MIFKLPYMGWYLKNTIFETCFLNFVKIDNFDKIRPKLAHVKIRFSIFTKNDIFVKFSINENFQK